MDGTYEQGEGHGHAAHEHITHDHVTHEHDSTAQIGHVHGSAVGALDKLKALGARVTVARVEVLNTLESSHGHLTADAIAASVQEQQPAVHRATVYRTLESLVEAGVVTHTHLGHGAAVYHLVHDEHIHSQCQQCGLIIDLDAGLLAAAGRVLLSQHGFVLDPSHSALLGTCGHCAGLAAAQPRWTPGGSGSQET